MVNVLQAMLLTDGPRMVKTPTYHVFDLYRPWQNATALPVQLASPWYHHDEVAIPAVSASAVRGSDGRVHLALVNLDPNRAVPVSATLSGLTAGSVTGRIITAATMDAHNRFEEPDNVTPQPFTGASVVDGAVTVALPAKSVLVLQIG
jgi:alpha-L-arabinofuranosidase